MAVYVDDAALPFRHMKMCHMVADSTEELLRMADKLSVQRKWIQYPGTLREHFDVCMSKRKLAIQCGAKPVTWRWVGERLRRLELEAKARRDQQPSALPSAAVSL